MLTAAAIVIAALSVSQEAQPVGSRGIASATAVLAEQPPAIDGSDADDVWQGAPKYSQFRQFEPRVDAEPTFRTESSGLAKRRRPVTPAPSRDIRAPAASSRPSRLARRAG